MRITWLLETADQLWGGVKVALEAANWLHHHGHTVTVVSRSGPPGWLRLDCAFRQVPDFRAANLPDGDVVIGTFWTTVPWAAAAGAQKGVPVHFCQGYEGDSPEHAPLRDRIEAVYRLPGMHHLTISPHLTRKLRERFGLQPVEVGTAIDHATHFAGPARNPNRPIRVGLVGPYQMAGKDLATGFAACRLAHQAGLPLVLVRVTNTQAAEAEQNQPFEVEWHRRVPPERMGDIYRSLDVLLGTTSSVDEGFFLPAVEAMACGIPTVLTDVPCFRAHGEADGNDRYALFVPPGDPAAMAEALVVAASVPSVRATLRDEGLRVAARYHPDLRGTRLEAALRALVPAGVAAAAPAAPAAPIVPKAPKTPPNPTNQPNGDPLPGLLAALLRHGRDLLARQQPAAGLRCLFAAVCLQPDDAALREELAQAQFANADFAAALQTYDELLARGHDGEALHIARGELLHRLGRMHDAAQAFRAALAVGTRNADAYNRLGVVLFQAGDRRGAQASFERAMALEPAHVDAHANLVAITAG